MKKTTYTKKYHKFYFSFIRIIIPFLKMIYHFSYKVFPVKKGEQYLILSNHQTLLDPALVCLSFKTPVYIMANDTLFKKNFLIKLLRHCFAPIKKRKALSDLSCIKECVRIAKEGGSILVFPEGNRAWADFQMYIDPAICKFVRLLKMPLVLYNLSGGYGVDPRWGNSLRKGKFHGEVKEVLSVEQIQSMDDDELYEKITSSLRVIDSERKMVFRSKKRAEYLERELFVCPKCKEISTLESNGNSISCNACGFKADYMEDLSFDMTDDSVSFQYLVDWYRFQLRYLSEMKIETGKIIYSDSDVAIYDKTSEEYKEVSHGQLVMTDTEIRVGAYVISLIDVVAATVVGANKLVLCTRDKSFQIKGMERFNALKYVLTFNRLNTGIEKEKYYDLSI